VFLFLALSMDALAIAAQAMVGRSLGAVDALRARAMARRMLELGVSVGVGFGVVLAAATPFTSTVYGTSICVSMTVGSARCEVAAHPASDAGDRSKPPSPPKIGACELPVPLPLPLAPDPDPSPPRPLPLPAPLSRPFALFPPSSPPEEQPHAAVSRVAPIHDAQ
jgi:hypothetical protein